MASTRKAGRQSSSLAMARERGRRDSTSRASESRVPRTALTERPSGDRWLALLPKKERKINDDPSTRSHSGRDRAISQLLVLSRRVADLRQHLGRVLAEGRPGGIAAGGGVGRRRLRPQL